MKRVLIAIIAASAVTVTAGSAVAQTNPLTASAKGQFDMIKANVVKTANKVGPELYSFKPTPEVRSLGEILGHIADANFGICAAAAGEKPTQSGYEKKTAKDEIIKGLNDSIAYCDKVIASLDDTKGAAIVPFFGMQMPKLGILYFNVSHNNEHYGNLVTYMRLKGIIPPSSEPAK
jgi:uncharacterized damage-inducible protein DinB